MDPETTPTDVHLHIEARGEGPLLALAHGFGGSARNFRPQARDLSDTHRVVTWDARGHARSAAPDAASAYSLDALAEDVGRVLDVHATGPAVVGGLSLGAASALAFARAQPGRVRGVVIASYPASRSARDGGFARIAAPFADAIEREGLEAAGGRFVWGPGSGLDPRGAELVRQGFLEHPPHALAHLLRGVIAQLPEPDALAAQLGDFRLPTLLVAGERDPDSVAACRTLHDALPASAFHIVPGAGHVVNLAAPKAFNALLREFLAGLDGTGLA